MAVEVRQMVVKSNVLDDHEEDEKDDMPDMEAYKEAILDECKRLILEALRDVKER